MNKDFPNNKTTTAAFDLSSDSSELQDELIDSCSVLISGTLTNEVRLLCERSTSRGHHPSTLANPPSSGWCLSVSDSVTPVSSLCLLDGVKHRHTIDHVPHETAAAAAAA